MAEQVEKFQDLDATTLTPLVRSALGRDALVVSEWQFAPLGAVASQVMGTSFGVFRLTGQAIEPGQPHTKNLPWSLILKIIGTTPGSTADDPTHFLYWKCEVLIYQSGILEQLPDGIKAPRCFAVVEKSSHEYWVWFEEVQEAAGGQWSLARYGLAGRHFGQTSGAYLAGKPIPKQPWLAPARTPSYLAITQVAIDTLPQLAIQPIAKDWLTESNVKGIQRLWTQRAQLLAALERLPRSLCHHDCHRRNLIARVTPKGREETVAIDWAYVGTGAVGVDASLVTVGSLRWMEAEASQARALDQEVFAGYLDGLRMAGWQGDERLARFGYTANAALFSGLGHFGVFLPWFMDEAKWPDVERMFGHPVERVMAQSAELQPFLLDLGDEALALMEKLGLGES